MPIIVRPLVAVAALLVAGRVAQAYDAFPPDGREPACSALCRSWMGLGAADAPEPSSPAKQVSPPGAAAVTRSIGGGTMPVVGAPRRAVAAQRPVPLPVPRPLPTPPRREVARAPAASPLPAARMSVANGSVVEGPAAAPSPAFPPVSPVSAVASPVVAVAAPPIAPARPDATPPAAAETARQTAEVRAETPAAVKLGFYAVLAGLLASGSRRRGPARARAGSRGLVRLDIVAQHAGVDGL